MPKFKFTGLPTEEPDLDSGPTFYDGEKPPAGVYRGTLKMARIKTNKNGDDMINVLVEIKDKGEKSQYNGYPMWGNINVTPKSSVFVGLFCAAIGAKYSDMVKGNVQVDKDDPPNILKVGRVELNGDMPVLVRARDNNNDGAVSLQVGSFLRPKEESGDDDVEEADDVEEDDDVEVEADEEEEEGDERATREAELGEMSRSALVKIARGDHEMRVTKSMTDEDIATAILDAEFTSEEDGEDEEEDEDEPPF